MHSSPIAPDDNQLTELQVGVATGFICIKIEKSYSIGFVCIFVFTSVESNDSSRSFSESVFEMIWSHS